MGKLLAFKSRNNQSRNFARWCLLLVVLFAVSAAAQDPRQELLRSIEATETLLDIRKKDSEVLPVIDKIRTTALAKSWDYEYGLSFILESEHYFLNDDWQKAIQSARKAVEIANKINNRQQKAELQVRGLNAMGSAHSYPGDYAEALSLRLQALRIADSGLCSKQTMGDLLSWIADDYRHLDQHGKAIEYLEKGKPYLASMTNEGTIDYYYTYCQSLAALGKKGLAVAMLSELDAFIASGRDWLDSDRNLGGLQSAKLHGEFAMKNNLYREATKYYNLYLHFARQTRSDAHMAIALFKMGRAYKAMGNHRQSLDYFLQAHAKNLEIGDLDYAVQTADAVAQQYADLKDYPNAYLYGKKAFVLKDSLNATERIKELHFLEAKYQAGQKEKEITALRLANTQQELKTAKRDRQIFTGGAVAFAIILILGFSYRNSRNRRVIIEKEIEAVQQRQHVASLRAMIQGQEKERTRIAKDLHDSMGGTFSTVKMYLSALEHNTDDANKQLLVQKSIAAIGEAATEMRQIAHNMMPEVLMRLGLTQAVRQLAENINSSGALQVTHQEFGLSERLDPIYEIALYRIVQELLNNVLKHSGATRVMVQFVKEGPRLNISVEDNGKGIVDKGDSHGFGMQSVRERVQSLSGNLTIDSMPGQGTTVMIEFVVR